MKIALVATGGTIGCRKDANGTIGISDAATEQIATIIGASGVFDAVKVHSESIRVPDLNAIYRVMQNALKTKPDAVIVSHGTDTLAFTAAYLSYAFCDTEIPIVLCSADLPLTERDSNGFAVLSSAKMFVQSRKPGVFVVYKNPGLSPKIHHGAKLVHAHLYEDFYNSVGNTAFYDTGLLKGMNFELEKDNVLCVTPYVGIDYRFFDLTDCAAVVHASFRSGTVNTEDFDAFASAHPDIPMFWATGYGTHNIELAGNIVQCPGITQSALYIKLLIALNNNVKNLREFVNTNACGEIVELKH